MKHIEERIVRTFNIQITKALKNILIDYNVEMYSGEDANDSFSCWNITNWIETRNGFLDANWNVITEELEDYGKDVHLSCVYCELDETFMDLSDFIKFCYDSPRGTEYCFEWTDWPDESRFGSKRLQDIRNKKLDLIL